MEAVQNRNFEIDDAIEKCERLMSEADNPKTVSEWSRITTWLERCRDAAEYILAADFKSVSYYSDEDPVSIMQRQRDSVIEQAVKILEDLSYIEPART